MVSQKFILFSPKKNLLHCALATAQCIVIGPVCLFVAGWVCLCLWVSYHDNSKLRASILTELGLHIQLIKFWPSRTSGKGVCGGAKFLAPPYYSQRAVFASPLSAFFHFKMLLWLSLQWAILCTAAVRPSVQPSRFDPYVHEGRSHKLQIRWNIPHCIICNGTISGRKIMVTIRVANSNGSVNWWTSLLQIVLFISET